MIRVSMDKGASAGLHSFTQRGFRLGNGREVWASEAAGTSAHVDGVGTVSFDESLGGSSAYRPSYARAKLREIAIAAGAEPPEIPLTLIERSVQVVIGESRVAPEATP